MSREATEVSMVWSQRRDKEEPSPGRRAELKEQPPGETDRQAGLCGERLLATSGSIGEGGETTNQGTEQLHPVQELGSKSQQTG